MDLISSAFEPVVGLPCWHSTNTYGSMLMIRFGEPSLEVSEPRMMPTFVDGLPERVLRRIVAVTGAWTLLVELRDWRLRLGDDTLPDSESTNNAQIDQALRVLDGQALGSVRIEPSAAAAVFTFDLGAVLTTQPDALGTYGPGPATQWTLYQPDGRCLQVRDDATYLIHRADDPEPADSAWRAI